MRDRSKAPSYRWVILSTLSVTETISWGILYYAFGILLDPMEREMGWSRAESTAAFSIALLVSATFAVPAGRWVDRGGARLMMTLGSCWGTALLVAWARVESLPALYLIWAAVGVTMAAVLYEPAFAVLAKWFVHDRERGFTILTLAAGLASTIFNPIASLLAASLGWRQAVLVLAAILGATTIPMPASATTCRSSASRADQPVVPMTRLMPRRASTGAFCMTDSGVVKSMATSTPRQASDSGPPP